MMSYENSEKVDLPECWAHVSKDTKSIQAKIAYMFNFEPDEYRRRIDYYFYKSPILVSGGYVKDDIYYFEKVSLIDGYVLDKLNHICFGDWDGKK